MKLEPGNRVQDYVLVERLGCGAFGEVWKAIHPVLARAVAIKFATSESAVAALEREGVAQFRLDHPGIVRVLDTDLAAEPPYVVLEHVDGKSLRQVLRERGRLEIQDVAAIFRQLAEAVAYAHRGGVIHGDIKPENILLHEEGPRKTVRLTDFQLGAYMAGERPDVHGGVRPSLKTTAPLGTYHYLAPEQELGQPIDGRADLFALGVVLFEMATGTLPQGRDLPSDVNPAISWWWDHIFSRCYTGRERRYAGADELLKDLAGAESGPKWGDMPSQRGRAAAARAAAATLEAKNLQVSPVKLPNDTLTARANSVVVGADSAARARCRRSSPMAGLCAGLLALAIPIGILESIGGMQHLSPRRCRPRAAAADAGDVQATFMPVGVRMHAEGRGADEAEAETVQRARLVHELAALEAQFRAADTPRKRTSCERKIEAFTLRAVDEGYRVVVVDGHLHLVRRRY